MRFVRVPLFGLFLVVSCATAFGSGAFPFRGCGPVLLKMCAGCEGLEIVNPNRNVIGANSEYDFSTLPFYDPMALYIGMKSGKWGLHFYTIARNKRLDGWKVGHALLEVSRNTLATVNREPLTLQVVEQWKMSEFSPSLLNKDVPPASYGLLFKIKANKSSLDRAENEMRKVIAGPWTAECLTPPIAVLVGAGFEIPGLDCRMNVNGLAQSLAEAILYGTIKLDGVAPPISILASDYESLARLADYWTARDAATLNLWQTGELWNSGLGWLKIARPGENVQ